MTVRTFSGSHLKIINSFPTFSVPLPAKVFCQAGVFYTPDCLGSLDLHKLGSGRGGYQDGGVIIEVVVVVYQDGGGDPRGGGCGYLSGQ